MYPSGQSVAAALVIERITKHPTAKNKRDVSIIEVMGPILFIRLTSGKIDIEPARGRQRRLAQLIYIYRRGLGRSNYVTMIHTMKKLLIPLFSLLIAAFLGFCA